MTLFYKDIRDLLGRRVHLDLQRRRVRAASPTWTSATSIGLHRCRSIMRALGALSVDARLHLADRAGQRRAIRTRRPRARRPDEDPRPRLVPLQLGPAPHAQPARCSSTGTARTYYVERDRARGERAALHAGDRRRRSAAVSKTNSGRKPAALTTSTCAPRSRAASERLPVSVFARVFNCSTRVSSTASCSRTRGSPYYSRFPGDDASTSPIRRVLHSAPHRARDHVQPRPLMSARRMHGAPPRVGLRRCSLRWPRRAGARRRARSAALVPPAAARAARRRALRRCTTRTTSARVFCNFGMVGRLPGRSRQRGSERVPLGGGARRARGMNYSDGITPFVLAKITQRDGSDAYIMETGYRERQALSPYLQSRDALRAAPRASSRPIRASITAARRRSATIRAPGRRSGRTSSTMPIDPGWPGIVGRVLRQAPRRRPGELLGHGRRFLRRLGLLPRQHRLHAPRSRSARRGAWIPVGESAGRAT